MLQKTTLSVVVISILLSYASLCPATDNRMSGAEKDRILGNHLHELNRE